MILSFLLLTLHGSLRAGLNLRIQPFPQMRGVDLETGASRTLLERLLDIQGGWGDDKAFDVMRKNNIIGLMLLVFCLVCRYSTPVADFYAEHCYPLISTVLSRIASIVKFSLEEIVVLAFVVAFVNILVRAIWKKEGFFKWLGKTAVVIMWLYVWSYMGWGNNYFRTGLYERSGIQRVSYEPEVFRHFLDEYTRELNRSSAQAGVCDRNELEQEVRERYSSEMTRYGYTSLHNWQHVKTPLLNGLFSAVLVQGYMGPFFCESQVNRDLLENEYPYTAAHELAHLAGVTSEAEAGYWGYVFCRSSKNPAVRYSGYLGILPYVLSNAGTLLSEQEYEALTATLSDKVKTDYTEAREYWQGKRVGWIDKLQMWFYNLYLKSNGVSDGVKDYSGVVSMIMTMDANKRLIEI